MKRIVPGNVTKVNFLGQRQTYKVRFLIVSVIGFIAMGFVGIGILTGLVAANISIQSNNIKLVVPDMSSSSIVMTGGVMKGSDGDTPVSNVLLQNVTANGGCIILSNIDIPVLGSYSAVVHFDKLTGDKLTLSVPNLQANLSLGQMNIGSDAASMIPDGKPGTFAITGSNVNLGNGDVDLKYLTGTGISLHGFGIKLFKGQGAC